jgi:DNA ligase (NAD+)
LANSQEALEAVNDLESQLHGLDFEVDGVVFKVDRLDQRNRLGSTSKSPRWVIAYKFEKYEATTQLESIEVQVGKTGTITPVANLKPVEIAGSTVSRASLHNVDELERLDVRVGDWVVVEKAGKIIPHVVRVEKHRRSAESVPFVFPHRCPKCDSELVRDEGGVYIRCPNFTCPAKLRQRLIFFASRDGLDIDGLGEKIVDQLVEQGLVTRYEDLFKLREEQLLQLEKFGKRKAEKLLEGIGAAKDRGLARLLTSIAIRHVGSRVSSVLAQAFPDIDKLMAASVEELSRVPEVGPTIAASVHSFLQGSEGRAIIEGLRGVGVRLTEDKPAENKAQIFAGKTLVVTGTLNRYSRESIEKRIADLGGRAASSVSGKTDFLVAGEKAGSKIDKARELGIKVLTEDEFEQLVASASGGAAT